MTKDYHKDFLKVSLIMFYLKSVEYPMFFLLLSTRNFFGHLPDPQGYSRHMSELCTPTQTLKKWWVGRVGKFDWLDGVMVVALKILVTAQRPNLHLNFLGT